MKEPNPKAIEALGVLMSDACAFRMSNSLTRLLIDYLFYNSEGLPTDFENILDDLERLLAFLSVERNSSQPYQ